MSDHEKAQALTEFIIATRDQCQTMVTVCEGLLRTLEPQETKEKKLEEKFDFKGLFWEEKKGEKGPFQQTSEKANQNSDLWQTLKAKLKANKSFWQHDGFKYWNDLQQETVIDRRKIA